MKKVLFLALSLFLIYVAGMYRYLALMVLGVGQLFLLLFFTVQAHICGKRVQAGFRNELVTAVKGERFFCEFFVNYRGKHPLGSMAFSIRYGYGDKKRRKRLHADGDGRHGFFIEPMYCGMAELCLEYFRVYDDLQLGGVKRKSPDKMRVMVFPGERVLDMQMSGAGDKGESGENRAEAFAVSGNDELRQVREYREGDSCRYLHWKLSARTDELLVREYEQEKRGLAGLFLDLRGHEAATPQERDAFYELLAALVLGLLRGKDKIRVCWQETDVKTAAMEIAESAQCRELLARLYLMTVDEAAKTTEEKREKWGEQHEKNFILDMQLRLFQGKRLLYQFSGKRLLAEIQNVRILVGE